MRAAAEITIRRAGLDDFDRLIALYEAVAAEGKWIGGELPVDKERMRESFPTRFVNGPDPGAMFIAEAEGVPVGQLGMHCPRGVTELGMLVLDGWRGRG